MSKSPNVVANPMIQVLALLFLVLGFGLGTILGLTVKALGDIEGADLTTVTTATNRAGEFNWLLFEIGAAAGLVCCAVLLAASFRTVDSSAG